MNSIIKSIIIIIFFILTIYKTNLPFMPKINNQKIIFTFWEPREKIPGYLKLCIKTWKKFLTGYKIVILDYKAVSEYLGENLFSLVICKNMSLAVQSDAIRVALLYKYGGIWIDTDTIILNGEFLNDIHNYEFMMFRDMKSKHHFIGFIYSSKNSTIINEWFKQIINEVKIYNDILLNKTFFNKKDKFGNKYNTANYLGNLIIDPIIKNITENKFLFFDYKKMNIFPERKFCKNSSVNSYTQQYRLYYFQKGDPQIIINNTKGLILLHNSWTPIKYKSMTEEEFLKQDILLSKLLTKILELPS